MKKIKWLALALAVLVFFPSALLARDIAPVVSTEWLEKNLAGSKLKIVDIRKLEEYKDGHIPGSLNSFYGAWAIKRGTNQNELPPDDDLADLIRSLGIDKDSRVVIVGKSDTPGDLVGITRIAWTLVYGGLENVSLLDGGYNKWTADKKPVSKEAVKAAPSAYQPQWNKSVLATKDYAMKMMKQAVMVDTRLPDAFFGVTKMDFVARPGHVPGAVCLPSVWMYMKDGTFKAKGDVEAMASGVLGQDKAREYILYCDTGKFCSALWFALTQSLDYKNVKIYDGAMEEWTKDPQAPVVKYTW
ncbi:MAG TPA: rhodanese-like domain-containing protein [Syntrophorhabdaceae bacterium]|jgi:thiosulfate/3-mercaptopyruvate sulfurtransferase